jgi:hypothetical protein
MLDIVAESPEYVNCHCINVKRPTVRQTEKFGKKNSSGATEPHKSASSEGEGKELMNCAKRQEGRATELQRTLLPLSSTPFALILKQTVMIH